jgi:hypothetical protein
MKKLYKKIIFVLILFGVLGIVYNALALVWPDSPGGTELNVDDCGGTCDASDIAQMIQYFYEWGISLGGIAVFFSLIMAGFQYLTSAGNESKMRDAIDRIRSSFLGLVLLLFSFLFLNIINPELTDLKMPEDLTSASQNLDPIEVENPDTSSSCNGVTVYSEVNYGGNSLVVALRQISGNLNNPPNAGIGGEALSVRIEGFCDVELYADPNCPPEGDPMTTIHSSLPDLHAVYLNDAVICVRNKMVGVESSPCDRDCSQCYEETDCIISPAYCAWNFTLWLCDESPCETNCYECTTYGECIASWAESGCEWTPYETCEPAMWY